jgi:hypothetical protein
MSFLKTSLEKRIQELRKSIEAQSTELAAYEQVLSLETGKPIGRAGPAFTPTPVSHKKVGSPQKSVAASAAASPAKPSPAAVARPTKKRHISEEGMRNIIAATKKRWALQRAGKAK